MERYKIFPLLLVYNSLRFTTLIKTYKIKARLFSQGFIMFKSGIKLFILLSLWILIPATSFSNNIPMQYQGFWSGKSCNFSIEKYALFIGTNGYIYEDDSQVEFNFVFPKNIENWTSFQTVDNNPNFNYFYQIDKGQLVERYPPEGWDGSDYSFLKNQQTQDTIYYKCESNDPIIESKYGELLSLLDSSVVQSCKNPEQDKCLQDLFKFLDVNKDKRLHRAELNRGLRSLSLVSVLLGQNTNDDLDKTTTFGVYVAIVPFLPLITQTLMANIDYDGSNSLSIDEISQDRNDLFSAIVSAKDGVVEDIRSLPGVLQNFAPLLQGLGNFN